MLTRVNFLLGFGFLVALLFYFAFSYLAIAPLSRFAPDWVRPIAGAAVLITAGLTVQILSMAMSSLAGVATYARGPNALAIASQAAMVCGHGALGFAMANWFGNGTPPDDPGLVLIAGLYASGVAMGILEWRQRGSGKT